MGNKYLHFPWPTAFSFVNNYDDIFRYKRVDRTTLLRLRMVWIELIVVVFPPKDEWTYLNRAYSCGKPINWIDDVAKLKLIKIENRTRLTPSKMLKYQK